MISFILRAKCANDGHIVCLSPIEILLSALDRPIYSIANIMDVDEGGAMFYILYYSIKLIIPNIIIYCLVLLKYTLNNKGN